MNLDIDKISEVMYDKMVLYYDKMAQNRDHFNSQTNVLLDIFDLINIGTDDKILDAACGTGLVTLNLYRKGFKKIKATDGSPKMVEKANLNAKSAFKAERYLWDELHNYFDSESNFKCVMIFGHSLPHAPVNLLSSIFKNIYNGLGKGGKFIFDLRNWLKNDEGKLIQPNRSINSYRNLGSILLHDKEVQLEDKVIYMDNIQQIEYRVIDKNKQIIDTFTLIYHIYTIETLVPILKSCNFSIDSLEKIPNLNWPYDIFKIEKN